MSSGNLKSWAWGILIWGWLASPNAFGTQAIALAQTPQNLPVRAQFKHNGQQILLEIAITAEQQALGLMYRERLEPNRGMLFPFQPPRPVSFWMKNMRTAIDMIFLHENTILAIFPKVPPCTTPRCPTYGPDGLVDSVIELAPGRAEQLGLKVGDTLIVRLIQPSGVPKRE